MNKYILLFKQTLFNNLSIDFVNLISKDSYNIQFKYKEAIEFQKFIQTIKYKYNNNKFTGLIVLNFPITKTTGITTQIDKYNSKILLRLRIDNYSITSIKEISIDITKDYLDKINNNLNVVINKIKMSKLKDMITTKNP